MRRSIVTMLFLISVVGGIGMDVRAQNSAPSTPEGTPPVATYEEIADQYGAMRDAILQEGRQVTEQVISGEVAAIVDRMSEELQAMTTPEDLEQLIDDLQRDQVRFELPGIDVTFNGHLDGETIDGFVTGGGIGGFALTRSAEGDDADILAGAWNGTLSAGGETVDLEVLIEPGETGWTGTASIPAWELVDSPLGEIAYAESLPIGEMIDDQALPHAPSVRSYWARYAWGDENLSFQYVFDQDGILTMVQIAPEETFPERPPDAAVAGLTWPLAGLWWVVWGGESVLQNYHAVAPAQRYALDLLIWNDGATFAGDGSQNEDYWAWGQPIVAPADGTIVDVVDGVPDNVPGVSNPEGGQGAGNHVVLRVDDQRFIFLAHMQEGSIAVQVGDEVETGQLLGLVGNSGNSSEPHLHIHAQSVQGFADPAADGLLLEFERLNVDGENVENPRVIQGSFIAAP
ncbi:MAG: peptidoglycan DD-metalloendopeptidase family protein [Thermomicrobiales bacterium]|nr:peptidoglycan DD-metalloendopeptidase family protein [Thermomicrobiales bacterium]